MVRSPRSQPGYLAQLASSSTASCAGLLRIWQCAAQIKSFLAPYMAALWRTTHALASLKCCEAALSLKSLYAFEPLSCRLSAWHSGVVRQAP